MTESVAAVPNAILPNRLFVFRITDRITSQGGVVRAVTVAVEAAPDGFRLHRDWELIGEINRMLAKRDPRRFRLRCEVDADHVRQESHSIREWLAKQIDSLDLPFKVPEASLIGLLIPTESTAIHDDSGTSDD